MMARPTIPRIDGDANNGRTNKLDCLEAPHDLKVQANPAVYATSIALASF